MPKYFEDFAVGDEETFGAYPVTAEEIIDFASKYDPQPFHLDPEAAKSSLFGTLCASGWHSCAMAMRLMVDWMKRDEAASQGSPGVDEIRWLRPVVPGDVLSLHIHVLETRPSSSRPDIGSVRVRYSLLDQQRQPVMRFLAIGLFGRRPS
ncbi:MaoC family dehydratase [Parapedomonas caeni]